MGSPSAHIRILGIKKMSPIISRPKSQIIIKAINSPYINRYGSRSIQDPESINIFSTLIPDRTPQLMFDSIPSRTPSQISPQLLIPLPPDQPTRLPVIEHTGPPEIITVHQPLPACQPLMNPTLKNYNNVQKNLLKTYVGIKIKLASKTIKVTDVDPFVQKDIKFQNVSHVFDIIDNLKALERGKLREFLGKELNQEIPYDKSKWTENTGALLKGIIDMEIIFDTNTT
jgi:hypothetical protein